MSILGGASLAELGRDKTAVPRKRAPVNEKKEESAELTQLRAELAIANTRLQQVSDKITQLESALASANVSRAQAVAQADTATAQNAANAQALISERAARAQSDQRCTILAAELRKAPPVAAAATIELPAPKQWNIKGTRSDGTPFNMTLTPTE